MKRSMISLMMGLGLILFVSACGGSSKSTESPEQEEASNSCSPLLDWEPGMMLTDGHVELEAKNVRVEDGCLVFEVEYSGCGNERVDLYWNGIMTRSLPPQISLQPVILEPGLCEKWVQREVQFDYSKILENEEKVLVKFKGMEEMLSLKRN